MTEAVTLRPVSPADETFLYEVYASTRVEELAPVPWDDAQKAAFLRMQFNAQDAYYREQYPNGAFDVILIEGEPAGRLYVNRGPDEMRIIDIAMLPAYRNRRIGTHLIGALQTEATLARKPLRIHVERFNPALRLYERLGFQPIADVGVYLFLEWQSAE
jgi:ribosomal protein S18 acetylase RimI-like enzyme